MRKYLTAYITFIDSILESGDNEKIASLKEEHLIQIQFMQHERLIHLLVTILFAVLMFISIGILAFTEQAVFAVLSVLILLPLAPYIMHYYFLENTVQKMYSQYNTMCSADENCPVNSIPEECRTGSLSEHRS